eukprot:g3191.t1
MAKSDDLNTDWQRSAGDFNCVVCQRKRLPASEFSKKQAEPDRSTCSAVFRLRGGGGGEVTFSARPFGVTPATKGSGYVVLKTSEGKPAMKAGVRPGWRLVQLNGEELNGELGEIQSRLKAAELPVQMTFETLGNQDFCTSCQEILPGSSFSRKMRTKPPEKRRCSSCVEAEAEVEVREETAGYPDAKEGGGGKLSELRQLCAETAKEAEQVTGLKAVKGAGRGGRGRGPCVLLLCAATAAVQLNEVQVPPALAALPHAHCLRLLEETYGALKGWEPRWGLFRHACLGMANRLQLPEDMNQTCSGFASAALAVRHQGLPPLAQLEETPFLARLRNATDQVAASMHSWWIRRRERVAADVREDAPSTPALIQVPGSQLLLAADVARRRKHELLSALRRTLDFLCDDACGLSDPPKLRIT